MNFGIAARLGWLLALGGILAVGMTGYYAYDASRTLLIEAAKNELLTSTQVLARRITLTRESVSRDLHVLANHPAALAALDNKGMAAKNDLANLMHLLMGANPSYFQVRLISAEEYGLEKVRVDRDGLGLVRVEEDALQEKSHYPYVFNTLKLAAGETYLSRIVINHEHGSHAGLDQPTVLFAMPVSNATGQIKGLVAINLDLKGLFSLLAKDLPDDFKLFLANRDGDYLIHPDPEQTFGFDKGRRILIQDEFPLTRALVDKQRDSMVLEVNGGAYAEAPIVAAFIGRDVDIASDESRLVLGLAQPLAVVLRQDDMLGTVTLRIVVLLSLLIAIIAALLARFIARPINAMSAAVQNFDDDRLTAALPLDRQDEIGILARSFRDMRVQITQQLAELETRRGELEHIAQHDFLTGLPNRALFADRVDLALASARRNRGRLALLFIDLDQFKPINDTRGHAVGDQLLKCLADRIRDTIRESDTAARLGGDEFVVLLQEVRDNADAFAVADKIRRAIATPCRIDGLDATVSASIGVAFFPDHGNDLTELTKHADEAMYRAKEQGRDTVVMA